MAGTHPGLSLPADRDSSRETPARRATTDYRIEVADSGKLLTGSDTKAMNGADDVTAVWDTCPAAGAEVTVTATPSDASQDAELFLMDSDPADAKTAVRGQQGGVRHVHRDRVLTSGAGAG
ncbi:hypothetical protein [Streptomyces sp. NPDC057302]|uniref:hypothetical protein n=1 Tax=Streptomyces sp. NPDC057302 TaxID=3346094 RepID=UPI003645B331